MPVDADVSAVNLAATYRPRRFSEVVGHAAVTSLLSRAIADDRLPAQLLFSGPSGLGKTTLARICAAALLCENREGSGDACGTCPSCVDVADARRTHPDVVEFDAASHGGKEHVKELAQRAATAPARGRFRVYIIDEAHGLSTAGGQAFLKLLEEPPSHVVFMLCTTDPDKMLRTNRGRCVEFTLSSPSSAELAAHVEHVARCEGVELPAGFAARIVAATDPEIGVRGLLNSLQRVLSTLRSGASIEVAAAALGVLPPDALAAVTDQMVVGDVAAAVSALQALRSMASDATLRRELVDWAYSEFTSAVASKSGVDVALWRIDVMLAAPPGQLHTDVAVATLAASPTSTSVTGLRAQVESLTAVVQDLTGRVESMSFTSEHQDTSSAQSQENASEVHAPEPTPTSDPEPTPQHSATLEEFVEFVAAVDRVAAGVVRSSKVTSSPSGFTVTLPPALTSRLPAVAAACEKVSAEHGFTVTVVSG